MAWYWIAVIWPGSSPVVVELAVSWLVCIPSDGVEAVVGVADGGIGGVEAVDGVADGGIGCVVDDDWVAGPVVLIGERCSFESFFLDSGPLLRPAADQCLLDDCDRD